jgi:hypothetical protein
MQATLPDQELHDPARARVGMTMPALDLPKPVSQPAVCDRRNPQNRSATGRQPDKGLIKTFV